MALQEGPVIVCGLGHIGWPVLEYLRALGGQVVAIDLECKPDDPRLQDVTLIRGNYRDPKVLLDAGIANARGLLVLANNDLTNLAACLEMRRLNAQVKIVVRLFNETLVAKLGHAVSNIVALSSSFLAGPLIASTALSGDVLSRFSSAAVNWHIERITIESGSPLLDRLSAELARDYPKLESLTEFQEGKRLETGDSLLVVGPVSELPRLREAASGDEGLSAKWAGRLNRLFRTIYTTLSEIEWPVKIIACVFFAVILVGSVICWLSGLADTLPRGLFRTLNIMVTSADLREQDYPSPWQHVFISFLKMSGLLLTAAFTALLTNYLVRMRLRGALAINRIPESGHIVLCGLGTVGLRVLEVLRQQNVPVVVLEKVEGGRFLATARQLGATVMLGDGTVPTTLSRARTAQARALVATTSSDLANVEIALVARELNPKLRVVLRLDDYALAGALRQTANIRFALCLPQLIAPAFVLPLFGDRILSMFWIDQALYIVLEMIVSADAKGLLGRTKNQIEDYLECRVVIPEPGQTEGMNEGQKLLLIVHAERISQVLSRCYLISGI